MVVEEEEEDVEMNAGGCSVLLSWSRNVGLRAEDGVGTVERCVGGNLVAVGLGFLTDKVYDRMGVTGVMGWAGVAGVTSMDDGDEEEEDDDETNGW